MWETVKLGDFAAINYGFTAKASHEFGAYKFLRITDIQGGKVDWNSVPFCDVPEKKIKNYLLYDGDVVFARTGATTGKSFLVTNPKNSVFASYLIRVSVNRELISPKFISYFFQSKKYWEQVNEGISGAAQGGFNASKLADLAFLLPPLAEQQRIVEKLDAVFAEIDRGIELSDEQIAEAVKLESHSLTALFYSHEHRVTQLKEIALIKGGKRLPKGKKLTAENTGFPYIRVSDFNEDGSIDEKSVQFVQPDVQEQISRYTISSSDVYVSIAGTIGKTGIVPPTLDNANLTENAAKLILSEVVDRDFIYFFTKTTSFEKQAIAQTRQAAQPKLALERLGAVELPIYDLERQREIASGARRITEKIAQTIENRRKKLSNLTALKSAILTQELQPPQSKAA